MFQATARNARPRVAGAAGTAAVAQSPRSTPSSTRLTSPPISAHSALRSSALRVRIARSAR